MPWPQLFSLAMCGEVAGLFFFLLPVWLMRMCCCNPTQIYLDTYVRVRQHALTTADQVFRRLLLTMYVSGLLLEEVGKAWAGITQVRPYSSSN